MIDVAELVAGWIYSLQIMSWQQWVLRVSVLASGIVAAVMCFLWFPVVVSPALLATAVVLVLASVIRPDSLAPLSLVGVVALWWLSGGAVAAGPSDDGGSPWRWLSMSAVVAVFHLSTAFAAAAPSYARITGRAAMLMVRSAAGYVAVGLVAGAAVLGLTALPEQVLGFGWVAAGVVAVSAATVAVVAALRPLPR
ncbi:MAG: hypothetical protein Q4P15_04900 [Propionibacteriaceae bacterium]|nr:hypothetical protein [Propionibacteriaceae bacterium]